MATQVAFPYATFDELTAFVGSGYTVPDEADAERLLARAAELIDDKSLHRAQYVTYDDAIEEGTSAAWLRDAVCAQVEFWLEVGVEFGVVEPKGSDSIGNVRIGNMPNELAPRAARFMRRAGVLYRGVVSY